MAYSWSGSSVTQMRRSGLEHTASLWPLVRAGYEWVKRVAKILAHAHVLAGNAIKRHLRAAGVHGAIPPPQCPCFRRHTDPLPKGHPELLARCVLLLSLRGCTPAPIMIWSNSLAPIATTSGVRRGAKGPLQPWCYVTQGIGWHVPLRGCGPLQARNSRLSISTVGRHSVSHWRAVVSSVCVALIFVATLRPILRC